MDRNDDIPDAFWEALNNLSFEGFPPVPGSVGIPAYVVGFRDLPQVRRMYEVQRVLARLDDVSDARSAYGRAVSSATVQQAVRALAGLAALESLPFTLFP